MKKNVRIALAGNPNSGKTTLFNNLTGLRQNVGNYPGVTVEKREGSFTYKDHEFSVTDLPGTYSLTAHSADEIVTRKYLIEEKPDVVIHVIDSSNLERNLYLATQLMQLGAPLVLAFNMYDLIARDGLVIDKKRLSELLGAPIVSTVATKNKGTDELLQSVIDIVKEKGKHKSVAINYGEDINQQIVKIENLVRGDADLSAKYPVRWLAIKLLEKDAEVLNKIKGSRLYGGLMDQVEKSAHHLKSLFGDGPEVLLADGRYGFISGACSETVRYTFEDRHTTSDKIDKVIINQFIGMPIFLGLMWLVFKFIFAFSQPLMTLIERGQYLFGQFVGSFFQEGSAIRSLLVDGVINGVGSVLVFVPVIFLLFFAMSILEYSGYMARAAFLMDRYMHKIGLHGRSFISMLLGFGCNVPAIMSTRTIEDQRDRLVMILINPFMSCGARLPVYILFTGAFFSEKNAGNILFSIYILGIIVAVIMAKIFKKSMSSKDVMPFVMELPPYRIPTLKGVVLHMWERGVHYLKKAGTVIFAGCVLIWFLSNFPWNPEYSRNYGQLIQEAKGAESLVQELESQRDYEKLKKSYAGQVGRVIAPVFAPLGFGDWRPGVSLVGGFVAKEIVVGMLGTLYSVSDATEDSEVLRHQIRDATNERGEKIFTPLSAYSFMVFVLLYIPCIATIAVIRQEVGTKWAVFTVFYTTSVAWIVSFIVYQGGRLLGLG